MSYNRKRMEHIQAANSSFGERVRSQSSASKEEHSEDMDNEEKISGKCLLCGGFARLHCTCYSWYCSNRCHSAHWNEHHLDCRPSLQLVTKQSFDLMMSRREQPQNMLSPRNQQTSPSQSESGQITIKKERASLNNSYNNSPPSAVHNQNVDPTKQVRSSRFEQVKNMREEAEQRSQKESYRSRSKSEHRSIPDDQENRPAARMPNGQYKSLGKESQSNLLREYATVYNSNNTQTRQMKQTSEKQELGFNGTIHMYNDNISPKSASYRHSQSPNVSRVSQAPFPKESNDYRAQPNLQKSPNVCRESQASLPKENNDYRAQPNLQKDSKSPFTNARAQDNSRTESKPYSFPKENKVPVELQKEVEPKAKLNVAPIPTPSESKVTGDNVPTVAFKGKADSIVKGVHCTSPHSFYVQYVKDDKILNTIQQTLQASCSSDKNYHPQIGDLCAANFDDDWYRALILAKTKTHYEVLYIDYGNEDSVEFGRLSKLTPALMGIKNMAHHCSLYGVAPSNEEWSDEEKQFFWTNILCAELCLEIITKEEDVAYVKLADKTTGDVAETLIQSSGAIALVPKPPVKKQLKAQDPSELKIGEPIQIINAFIEDIFCWSVAMKDLKEYDSFRILEEQINATPPKTVVDPKPGDSLVAFSPKFNLWYRAKVLKVISPNQLKVFYVDYGNVEVVQKFKELKEEWKIPSKLFRLYLPENFVIDTEVFKGTVTSVKDSIVTITMKGNMKITGEFCSDYPEAVEVPMAAQRGTQSNHLYEQQCSPVPIHEYKIVAYQFNNISPFSAIFENDLHLLAGIDAEIADCLENQETSDIEIETDEMYLARHEVTGKWARAYALNDSPFVEFYFLDYGTINVVSRKFIRNAPESLKAISGVCSTFTFGDFVMLNNVSDINSYIEEKLPLGEPFKVTIVEVLEDEHIIIVPGLAQHLCSKGVAQLK